MSGPLWVHDFTILYLKSRYGLQKPPPGSTPQLLSVFDLEKLQGAVELLGTFNSRAILVFYMIQKS